jgi:hypothetical protein
MFRGIICVIKPGTPIEPFIGFLYAIDLLITYLLYRRWSVLYLFEYVHDFRIGLDNKNAV